MSLTAQFYAHYQSKNPERFNDEVIKMRKRDNPISYFRDMYSTLSLAGIDLLDVQLITDETEHSKFIDKRTIAIEESRLDLIKATFRLTAGEESEDYEFNIFFPKIIDDFFFYLNGNRYFAIYQIADKNFYSVRNGVFLKTLLMPLGVKYSPASITDIDNVEYSGRRFVLEFFKTSSNSTRNLKNAVVYMFIKFGVEKAIEFLNESASDDGGTYFYMEVGEQSDAIEDAPDLANYTCFEIRKDLRFYVFRDYLRNANGVNMAITIVDALSEVKRIASIDSEDFWKKKILNSPTTKLTKADKAIVSLERILDGCTKRNLRDLAPKDKEDVYAVVRYILANYEEISTLDNVNIYNRRIRLVEYLIFPLLQKFSDQSYRILNSKSVDLKRLRTVFSAIGPMFLIKRLTVNELLRYSNVTNSCELFSAALKWSARGPQALNGGNALLRYRAIHPSYIGNLGLLAASAGDPGLVGTINPFCKNIHEMFFEEPENGETE